MDEKLKLLEEYIHTCGEIELTPYLHEELDEEDGEIGEEEEND